jgi:glycosyltransferase involved in cell wall biosynthesis
VHEAGVIEIQRARRVFPPQVERESVDRPGRFAAGRSGLPATGKSCSNVARSVQVPSVSLCVIVKNEAEMLPRFLTAARGVWDELCVVDTGSTDATVSILEAAGARITHRPWDDDFAAARNASLDMATGEFVLMLDADEMLSPPLIQQIRDATRDRIVGAATVVMRNMLPGGHKREARLLRLFRAHPSIRFEFPIHEDVTRSLMKHLQATGRHLVHLPGFVEHLGYVRERAAARNKHERDARILRRCVDKDPSDFYSWFKLLEVARFWQDRPGG